MRDGAGLINASRGGVVNEPALYKELAQPQQRIAAYLDVWVGEPNIDIQLAHLCDIATPHIAGYSVESKQRAMAELSAFRRGKKPNLSACIAMTYRRSLAEAFDAAA